MQRLIVIEGLIGAGKTTLCRLLAEQWGAQLVLEPSENNPFLAPYYADPKRYAFPVQMFYLVNRWRQQDQIRQPDLFHGLVVSDYLFAKDRMFAEKTLEPQELELYDRFASALGESSPRPDLVIYLDVPTPVLLRRIARRACEGESAIDPGYLDDLRERYERLWSSFSVCPVLRLDNRDMNYADEPDGQRRILEVIAGALEGVVPSHTYGGVGARSPEEGAPGFESNREDQPSLFGAVGG